MFFAQWNIFYSMPVKALDVTYQNSNSARKYVIIIVWSAKLVHSGLQDCRTWSLLPRCPGVHVTAEDLGDRGWSCAFPVQHMHSQISEWEGRIPFSDKQSLDKPRVRSIVTSRHETLKPTGYNSVRLLPSTPKDGRSRASNPKTSVTSPFRRTTFCCEQPTSDTEAAVHLWMAEHHATRIYVQENAMFRSKLVCFVLTCLFFRLSTTYVDGLVQVCLVQGAVGVWVLTAA